MPYDWTKPDDGFGEKIPAGTHRVTIMKVITHKASGNAFVNTNGDPYIMIVYEDREGREAASTYTLSQKSAWTLKMVLSRCGCDLEELKNQGIEPAHFKEKSFAESHLVGRKLWISIEWELVGQKEYARIEPLNEEDAGVTVVEGAAEAAPSNDPTIPF